MSKIIETRSPHIKALLTALSRNPGSTAAELRELIGPDVLSDTNLSKRLYQFCEDGTVAKEKRDGLYAYYITQRGVDKLGEPAQANEDDALTPKAEHVSPAQCVNSIFQVGRKTGYFNNAPTPEYALSKSLAGAEAKKSHDKADGVLSQLGQATENGLGWVAGVPVKFPTSDELRQDLGTTQAAPSQFKQWLGKKAQEDSGTDRKRSPKSKVKAPDPLSGFRCALFDDGSLLIELGGQGVQLDSECTARLMAYTDMVRRVGNYAQ